MIKNLVVKRSLIIDASVGEVWEALTNAQKIKKYFFGVDVISEWESGKPIIFQGDFQGESFRDKGTILEIEPEKFIKYNYYSAWSGLEDRPENYSLVTYELGSGKSGTEVKLMQKGFASEEAKKHAEQSWDHVLMGLKEVAENKK